MSKDDNAETRIGVADYTLRQQSLTMSDAMFKARSAGLLRTGGLPNDQEKWKAETTREGNVVLRRIIDLIPNKQSGQSVHLVKELIFSEVTSGKPDSSGSARLVREVRDAQHQVTASEVIEATIENSSISRVHYFRASTDLKDVPVDVYLTLDMYGRITSVERWKRNIQGEDKSKQGVHIRHESESANSMRVYGFEGIPQRELAADEHYYDLPEYKFLSDVTKDTGMPISLDLTNRRSAVDTQASLGVLIKLSPASAPALKSAGEGLQLSHFFVPHTLSPLTI